MIPNEARQKYHHHKADAKRRGIDFFFSLEGWWAWWQQDNRWEKRGRGKGKLCMARFGDTGPYHPDNVHCATHAENAGEVSKETKRDGARRGHETRRRNGNRIPLELRGSGHPRAKAVITPAGRFGSGWLAADHYGISRNALYDRIKRGMSGYHWADAAKS